MWKIVSDRDGDFWCVLGDNEDIWCLILTSTIPEVSGADGIDLISGIETAYFCGFLMVLMTWWLMVGFLFKF